MSLLESINGLQEAGHGISCCAGHENLERRLLGAAITSGIPRPVRALL